MTDNQTSIDEKGVQIGTHGDWKLFVQHKPAKFDRAGDRSIVFLGVKDRKVREDSGLKALTQALDNEDAREVRAKVRHQPLKFRLWHGGKEHEVEITSFSAQGLKLRNQLGELLTLEVGGSWRGEKRPLRVVKPGKSMQSVFEALAAVKIAEHKLEEASADALHEVEVANPGGDDVRKYFEAEDALREAVRSNKLESR